ncbi:hypothetical protein K491DRAFT_662465 [Lophiostoma macrostomum CBS 122681]|uniref:Glycoside hydrolase family 23 protein n=1 Tax=Lophiostoma macrostomum CBS 122681 TaxID=1314788 RepID=A0A6A6T2L7_9PLEO|nr:hypothetical protein K491DRAFT_662465 [Lophiostoma macrostomum CBS 122681]
MFSTFQAILCIFPVVFGSLVARSVPRSTEEQHGYTQYTGDGSPDSGWPKQSDWVSFDALWIANQGLIQVACAQWGLEENSEIENSAIYEGLNRTASSSALPPAFLLAIMMQESRGCVRVPTTFGSVSNPGLFQSHEGPSSCNNGTVVSPCPNNTISGMISEGAGIGLQFGLTQALNQSRATDDSKFYKAARIYNSGSIDPSGDLGRGGATHCYSSDIANRLQGWTNETSNCNEAEGTMSELRKDLSRDILGLHNYMPHTRVHKSYPNQHDRFSEFPEASILPMTTKCHIACKE